jgi:hypothetical protein
MNVDLARGAIPGSRGNHQGDDDACDPLEKHQPGEKLVGLAKDLSPVLLEKLLRAIASRF